MMAFRNEIEAFAKKNKERVELAESIKCPWPYCKAKVGKRCRTKSGNITWWHSVRRKESGAADALGNWL